MKRLVAIAITIMLTIAQISICTAASYAANQADGLSQTGKAKLTEQGEQTEQKITLTADERQWLNNHEKLIVGGFTNDTPDIVVDEETGEMDGLTPRVLEIISERLDIKLDIELKLYDTVDEMLAGLDAGEVDVIMPFYCSDEYAERCNLIHSNTLRTSTMTLIYDADSTAEEAMKYVATPGTRLGWMYMEDCYPESELVEATSVKDAVDLFRSGKASGAVAHSDAILRYSEIYNDVQTLVLEQGCKVCFATRRVNEPLISIINKGLAEISDTEINRLVVEYSPIVTYTTKEFLQAHPLLLAGIIFGILLIVALAIELAHVNNSKRIIEKASKRIADDDAIIMARTRELEGERRKLKEADYLLKSALDEKTVNMMGLTEGGNNAYKPEQESTDILSAVRTVHGMLRDTAHEQRVSLSISSDDVEHRVVNVDKLMLTQLIRNLLNVAIQNTSEGDAVLMTIAEHPSKSPDCARYEFAITSHQGNVEKRDILDIECTLAE